MTTNFCNFLTAQLRVEYGKMAPCCWFNESDRRKIDSKESVIEFVKNLNDITDWESSRGACNFCKNQETRGLFSPRKNSFITTQLSENSKVQTLELQLDRDCNAACLICGPWNSTTWEKYDFKIKNIPVTHYKEDKTVTLNYIQQVIDSVDFSELQTILFLGGEPLRTETHLEFLNLIPIPENVTVKYTTNGSYFPDPNTLETWKKFKKIIIQFSIDGIDDHFNYLRWPLQWSQVTDNLLRLSELNSNIHLSARFSYTVTALNIFYHDRYVEWSENNFGVDMFCRPWAARNSKLDLSAIPADFADIIREKYGHDHEISKLLVPYNPAKHREMLKYLEYHDQHRKRNWRHTFPEVAEYLQ